MKMLPLLTLTLALTTACNTTPETTLNEDFPPLLAPPPATSSASEVETEASAKAPEQTEASPEQSTTTENSEQGMPENNASAPQQDNVSESSSEAPFQTFSSGNFQDAVHKVSGNVLLIQGAGQKFIRLEDFLTENGPDLHLYLVQNPTGSPVGNDFINLGKLKSTQGNVNYEIPADVDLSTIQSVSVWCKAFSVNFGFATLSQESLNS